MKYSLVLRTCKADMSAHSNFVWPEKGPVSCSDFKPIAECGQGLHGFLNGEGDYSLASWEPDAKWLVVKVLTSELIHLDGKVKFPRGTVVYCGDRLGATNYLQAQGVKGAIMGANVAAGYRGTATAGDGGTATAGNGGTATAGNWGTATAGYRGTATAGYRGILRIQYHDTRYRWAIAYVGEKGILPNVKYKLDGKKFVKA